MDKLLAFNTRQADQNRFGDLRVGWTVKVHLKFKDGDKAKAQIFEGMIIARKHGNEAGATITVRKMSSGIGVEKVLPLRMPSIDKIEVVKKAHVRRTKLYYLREKSAKEIRKKTKQQTVVAQKAETKAEAEGTNETQETAAQ